MARWQWWWRRRDPPSDDELRLKSARLRQTLIETTAELDEFVAALNAEVGRQRNMGSEL